VESRFDKMTNKELEELLYRDARDGDLSGDELLYITELLERRQAFDFPEPSAQLERFNEIYLSGENDGESLYDLDEKPKSGKILRFRRAVLIAAAVAVIAAVMTVTAGALGQRIARPSYDIAEPVMNVDEDKTDNLQSVFEEYGVPFSAPEYIPIDCVLRDLTAYESDGNAYISAEFLRWSTKDALLIDITEGGGLSTEGDIYEHEGTEFYITETAAGYTAVWLTDGWRGMISGGSTLEELVKIIDSIQFN